MHIKKSRLQQIIKEEVNNAKFIEVREEEIIDRGPASEEEGDNTVSPDNISLDELITQEVTNAMEGLGDFAPSSDPLENIKTRLKNKNMNPDNDMEAEVKDELANHPHLRDKILTFYYGELADINKRKMQRDTSDGKGVAEEGSANESADHKGDKKRSVTIDVSPYGKTASQDYEKVGGDLTEKEDWIQKANLKKGECADPGDSDCPEGSRQYNLAMNFKHGAIHRANLAKGKNPKGPG